MPLSVLILAAGQGKRMNSEWPKVLQPLAGRALLKHVIDTARQLRPDAIHVVYGHGAEQVREAFKGEALSWVLQERQLGTGHAVLQALPRIPDGHTVLVLYGDVPLIRRETLEGLLKLAGPKTLAVLTVMLADPGGYGRILRDARGRIRRIVEHQDASKRELRVRESNTGIIAAPAKLLKKWLALVNNNNAQGEYYLTDIAAIATREKFNVVPQLALTEPEVLGVNDKVQLAQVEAAYRRERAQELMLSGVTVIDPQRLDIRGTVTAGRDVQLDVNVILEGKVRLGDRVWIGPNCVVRDTAIGADTRIFANCVLDNAVIGPSCSIGPFARLRPGAALGRGVHIGNFVEVKNATIGDGSKANHLTYLGDALIGKDVNVGAGTITCNYDGVNKSQTHIEDGVFIGSGSMLVAPVRIGARATIGAGSTITEDAPADKLTLGRSRQVSIDSWARPAKRKKS
ncbi:MAG TPA: bifunctional UDP-N-acetylglucosamine diphosphorylase/glucosamine-1-phosphate N-acetyltransferase GlmU [Steroidobacteraceae bacterium]|jgi:bifunctional UDP-N-acetylglucosamine pyrophosphorylase/glucosamine-1-phosphate N-acetyltransferase|nr:bifunctional UDP-N-acetylglucosamine diphosphorylase/glucosamine-1-phosphate N-acetyltransferase GlmU [Steroidobacteraceae bacterium]